MINFYEILNYCLSYCKDRAPPPPKKKKPKKNDQLVLSYINIWGFFPTQKMVSFSR